MKVGSLFTGIGGFDLGLESAGMQCMWQVEIDRHCNTILEKRWPKVRRYSDVRECGRENLEPVDLICGGFPCQDLSVAGKRSGLAGKRSGLFFEFMRIVAEMRPEWVIIENVPGLLSSNGGKDMALILRALESLRYSVECDILDAQHHGIPQRRRRVFLVCHDVSGPPKRTNYYAHIGLQVLGEILLGVLEGVGIRFTIAPTGLGFKNIASANGCQQRMKLFKITSIIAFEKWRKCLEEVILRFQNGLESSASRSGDAKDTGPIEMDMFLSQLEMAMALYAERWNIEWSWGKCWGDLLREESVSTTLTETSETTARKICSYAIALLTTAKYTLDLMRFFPNWYNEESWISTESGGLINYARQSSESLFEEALGGANFWRTVEQCSSTWQQFIVGCLGNARSAAEVLFEPESMCRDTSPRRETGTRVAASLIRGAESRGKSGYSGRRREDDVNLAAHALTSCKTATGRPDLDGQDFVVAPLTSRPYADNEAQDSKLIAATAVRRLTPTECERLQGFPEVEEYCIIDVCLDRRKNFASVEISNPKSLRLVGNAVSAQNMGFARSAERSLSTSGQPTAEHAPVLVHIGCGERIVEIHSQGKLLLSANIVENESLSPLPMPIVDFARLLVGLVTTAERTIHRGMEESQANALFLTHPRNGNKSVRLSGSEMTRLVNDAMIDSTICREHSRSIISSLSGTSSLEHDLTTLSSCVLSVITGFILPQIRESNSFRIEVVIRKGWTEGCSDSARYRMLGNAVAVPVAKWIGQRLMRRYR